VGPEACSSTNRPVITPAAGWSVKKLNPDDAVNDYWDLMGAPPALPAEASTDNYADRLNELLTSACYAAKQRRTVLMGKSSVNWWKSGIADLRKIDITARRKNQRTGRRSSSTPRETELEAYSRERADLKRAIRKGQEKSWMKLCLAVDNDSWGVPYRLHMLKGSSVGLGFGCQCGS